MQIKDKIALGALVGLAATIPQLAVNIIAVKIGFVPHYALQYAASIFVFKNLTFTFWGMLFGFMIWESMAAGLGVITVYLIHWTGREYWLLKGLLISNTLMFIFLYGFYFGLETPKLVPWDLETNWTFFIENLIFGAAAGYLTVRWGTVETKQ